MRSIAKKGKFLKQEGFIPMMIALLIILAVIIYFAYTRVLHATK